MLAWLEEEGNRGRHDVLAWLEEHTLSISEQASEARHLAGRLAFLYRIRVLSMICSVDHTVYHNYPTPPLHCQSSHRQS